MFAQQSQQTIPPRIFDLDRSHLLFLGTQSDLTANRTLDFNTDDSDRSVKIQGDTTLDNWFDQSVKSNATPTFGGLFSTGNVLIDDNFNLALGAASNFLIGWNTVSDSVVSNPDSDNVFWAIGGIDTLGVITPSSGSDRFSVTNKQSDQGEDGVIRAILGLGLATGDNNAGIKISGGNFFGHYAGQNPPTKTTSFGGIVGNRMGVRIEPDNTVTSQVIAKASGCSAFLQARTNGLGTHTISEWNTVLAENSGPQGASPKTGVGTWSQFRAEAVHGANTVSSVFGILVEKQAAGSVKNVGIGLFATGNQIAFNAGLSQGEFIESSLQDFMDYYATRQHRFNTTETDSSGNFAKMLTLRGPIGTGADVSIWKGNQDPDTVLAGVAGDVAIITFAASSNVYICEGGTTWIGMK